MDEPTGPDPFAPDWRYGPGYLFHAVTGNGQGVFYHTEPLVGREGNWAGGGSLCKRSRLFDVTGDEWKQSLRRRPPDADTSTARELY